MLCMNRIESMKLKGINNSPAKGEEVLKPLKLKARFCTFSTSIDMIDAPETSKSTSTELAE